MIRNTLTALTLTLTVAQPAQANDDLAKILFGVILGAAIVDAAKNTQRTHTATQTVDTRSVQGQLAQRQARTTVCYTEDRWDQTGQLARFEYNCHNQLIQAYYLY